MASGISRVLQFVGCQYCASSCFELNAFHRSGGFSYIAKRFCSGRQEILERKTQLSPNSLDVQILKATDLESLSDLLKTQSLNISQATNAVTTLGRFVAENREKADDIIEGSTFTNVCAVIDKNIHSMSHSSLVSTLKNLLSMGIPSSSRIIQSLETAALWKARKMNLPHLLHILSFYVDGEQTDLQKKLVAELLDKTQQRWFEIASAKDIVALLRLSSHVRSDFIGKLEDRSIELIEKMPVADMHKIFITLAEQKLRPTHLLRALAFHMCRHPEKLSLKQMLNVAYAMNNLSFPDEALLQRISNDLLPEIHGVNKPGTLAAFLTAFGLLRWKHTAVLEAITEWMQKNLDKCRLQDVAAYIVTAGHLNFLPADHESVSSSLFSRITMDACASTSKSIWLNVVWSLAALQKASEAHVSSVLQPSFYQELLDTAGFQSSSFKKKLLNINAVAKLEITNYKGPLLPDEDVKDYSLVVSNPIDSFRKCVTDTLSNFVPKGKFLTCSVPASAGICVDAEFVLDKDGKPLSLEDYATKVEETQPKNALPSGAYRVRLLIHDYKHYTLQSTDLNGQGSLEVRLLKKMGYTVVQIPFFEFNPHLPTVNRLQYLQQKIANSMNNQS